MSIGELLSVYGEKYLQGLLTTWELTIFSFIGAMIIGVIITVFRVCPIKPLRLFGEFYVQIFRNIPGAALLILLVYALPELDLILSYHSCVLTATTLIPASFCSEYLMSGINAIGIGQIEAARSIGMTFPLMMRKIVIPQAVRFSILPMTNLLIATMLTTSLASQVPLSPTDLTGVVSYINTRSVGGVTSFLISAFFYCITAVVIGQLGNLLDKKVRILR
ncbi:MAG: ABC transporter permease subunit [Lachnospiraceae bacterium]|nr:ABC transporter permease subunit [Lachnospiraceae bacterium]